MTRRQGLLLACVASLGVALLFLAHAFHTQYTQGLFLNLGSSVLLFGAFYSFQRVLLERSVESVREETAQAVETATQRSDDAIKEVTAKVEEVRAELAVALEALGDAARMAVASDDALDATAIEAFRQEPSSASTRDLLLRGRRVDAISASGVRVQANDVHIRFSLPVIAGQTVEIIPIVVVTIEDAAGAKLQTIHWRTSEPAPRLFADVASALKRLGSYQGDANFDASKVMADLARAVSVGLDARAGRGPAPADLGPVIELIGDQWAVTDDGLEAIRDGHYVIEAHRFNEINWIGHMNSKRWVVIDEFERAFDVAEAIHGHRRGLDDDD